MVFYIPFAILLLIGCMINTCYIDSLISYDVIFACLCAPMGINPSIYAWYAKQIAEFKLIQYRSQNPDLI